MWKKKKKSQNTQKEDTMSDSQYKHQTAKPYLWRLWVLKWPGAEYKVSLFNIFKEITNKSKEQESIK